jgi:ribosomal protein L40E
MVNIDAVLCKDCYATYPIEYDNCPTCGKENFCNA